MHILELKDYRIFLGADIWKDFAYMLKQRAYSQILILVDENTARDCLPIFQVWVDAPFQVIEIPAGERYKTFKLVRRFGKPCLNMPQTARHSSSISVVA